MLRDRGRSRDATLVLNPRFDEPGDMALRNERIRYTMPTSPRGRRGSGIRRAALLTDGSDRHTSRRRPKTGSDPDRSYAPDWEIGCQGRTPYFLFRARPHQHPPSVRTINSPWITR